MIKISLKFINILFYYIYYSTKDMTASKNSEQTPFYEEKPYKNNLNQMFY